MLDQCSTPLFDKLCKYSKKDVVSFHTPGHKSGNLFKKLDAQKFRSFLGENVFRIDLSVSCKEIDSLHEPKGVIEEAQKLAAEIYDADSTFFLTSGSTTGNLLMIAAVCNPGDEIVIPDNMHKSVWPALVVSGAKPIYLRVPYDKDIGISLNCTVNSIQKALEKYPSVKAVFITSPSYYGIYPKDIRKIVEIVHDKGKKLLVDEAWGAHLKFLPSLPSAMGVDADMCVQSTHKTIGALSQASMLHIKGIKEDERDRLKKLYQMFTTTSPSYILLTSLDISRNLMATIGENLLSQMVEYANKVREKVKKLRCLCTLKEEISKNPKKYKLYGFDPTKITIISKRKDITGKDMAGILLKNSNIQVEMAGINNILLLITVGDDEQSVKKLIKGLHKLDQYVQKKGRERVIAPGKFLKRDKEKIFVTDKTPKSIFYSKFQKVRIVNAIGKKSAECVISYPPGIPIILPGEVITHEKYDYIKYLKRIPTEFHGVSDPELNSLKILVD